jgi:DNA-binding NarL/FixJ family response regulator
MAPSPIRVLLVDDHRTVLWGLVKLVESAGPAFELVATASRGSEALVLAETHRPDVIALDLDLGEQSSIELIPELRRRSGAKIVILTGVVDTELHERAVRAGARGIVHKSDAADVILKAIARVQAGEFWLERAMMGRVFSSPAEREGAAGAPGGALTAAERKVIAEVVRLRSAPNKVIADALGISPHTLRNHLSAVYAKLSLARRLDLVLYAIEHQLVAPAPRRA